MEVKQEILRGARRLASTFGLGKVPDFLVLVATSAIDAALHDAFGRVNGISSYQVYGPKTMERDLSFYLGQGFEGSYPSDFLRPPKRRMPIFHLVGALDKLTTDEVDRRHLGTGCPDAWRSG